MLDILLKRRSRRFYLDKEIEPEIEEKIIQSLLISPSSRNLKPWEFIIVKDKAMLENLSKAKTHGSSFLKDAPFAVVVLGNEDKSDVWIEDASIASIFVQLEAESLGLGSCWIQIRNRKHSDEESAGDYVRGLLDIPPQNHVLSIIAIGYSDEEREPKDLEDLDKDKIYSAKYGKPYFTEED